MRPGAPFAPWAVWHELQLPSVCMSAIAFVAPPTTTFAEYGALNVGAEAL